MRHIAIAIAVLYLAAPLEAAVRLRTRTIDASAADIAAPPGDPTTYVVAARGRVTLAWRRALEAAGATVLGHLPDDAFLVRVARLRASGLGAVGGTEFAAPYLPGDKLAPELAIAMHGRAGARLPVHILIAPDRPAAQVSAALEALGLTVAGAGDGGTYNDIVAFVPPGRLDVVERAAEHPDVIWIEPRARRVLLNDTSIWVGQSGLDGAEATPIFDQGIYGAGQTIAVLDTGLDHDSCYFADPSGTPPVNLPGEIAFDPTLRKVVAYNMLWDGDDPADPGDYDDHSHGTHVAGSALGDDLSTPIGHDPGDGMAPAAQLVVQDGGWAGGDDCADLPGLGCPVVDLTPIFDQAYQQGARIHSNSWGDRENFAPNNTYTAASVDTDEFMYDHPDFLILYAAGNAGPGPNTVISPSTAKSAVSVGATNRGVAAGALANFSSRGNTADGRLRPHITAPGVAIVSAQTDGDINTGNCGTFGQSGTSMACPTAAGLAALAGEYYAAGYYPSGARNPADGFTPSAALLKASLINSGRSMADESEVPSIDQGWGRVTLEDTLLFTGEDRDLLVVDERVGFTTGASAPLRWTIDVRGSAQPLKVTLVWTDRPSTPVAATNLVNDLDLRVIGQTETYLGNDWSGGASTTGGSADRLNTEEQVLVVAPTPGSWTIEVVPADIPLGPQPFALVLTADLPTPLHLRYIEHEIVSDQNANGWPDPGESIRLAIRLGNTSDTRAAIVTGTLSALTPELTVIDADAAWPAIDVDSDEPSIADHFELLIAPDVRCGARVPLQLDVVGDGVPFTATFELLVGGLEPVFVETFDRVAPGDLPAGFTVASNRPFAGTAFADATIEPTSVAPGPASAPHALYIGFTGDPALTTTEVLLPLDIAAYAGGPIELAFRWWAYGAEDRERLVASVGDNPPIFAWELLRTSSPFDSATDGGNVWGEVSVDLSTLAGFDPTRSPTLKLDIRAEESEADGDGFYVDDIVIRAPLCESFCAGVTADGSLTDLSPVCPGAAVQLDGNASSAAGCASMAYEWWDGPRLVATTAIATDRPVASTTYRLVVRCDSPPSCASSTRLDIPVLAGTFGSVDRNSLRAVEQGTDVALTWTGAGDFNVSSTSDPSALATLWQDAALNTGPLVTPIYAAPSPGAPLGLYRAFGRGSCDGASVP